MSDASDFFGNSSGLLVRPPKRFIPASRGSANVHYHKDGRTILSRPAAGTHLVATESLVSLINTSTGNLVASHSPSTLTGSDPALGAPEVIRFAGIVYDSAAGFYYGIVIGNTGAKLFRINDSTGAATNPGAAVTLGFRAVWEYILYAEISGGNVVFFTCSSSGIAYEHRLSISTGAIVSENQPVTLSDGTVVGQFASINVVGGGTEFPPCYVTADKSALIQFCFPAGSSGGAAYPFNDSQFGVSFAKGGISTASPTAFAMPNDGTGLMGARSYHFTGESLTYTRNTENRGQVSPGWRQYDRADFDRYVKAIIKAAAGV